MSTYTENHIATKLIHGGIYGDEKTGWRLGYVIASPEIVERAKKVHDFLTVGAAAPLMEAAVHDYVRLHFAKKDQTLTAAIDRLSDLKKKAIMYP